MTERYIKEGKLTAEGLSLAKVMVNLQCDRRPCAFCSKRRSTTNGPGGPGCPVEGENIDGGEVEEIITVYIGRSPGHEALDALKRIR